MIFLFYKLIFQIDKLDFCGPLLNEIILLIQRYAQRNYMKKSQQEIRNMKIEKKYSPRIVETLP